MSNKPSGAGEIAASLVRLLSPSDPVRLSIGGIRAAELVQEFGSPLYVYDAGILRSNLAAVREAVGDDPHILYALKANPNLAVARVLRLQGAGAEVASAGEIHAALAAGFEGPSMQFAGPGKTTSEVELGISIGLGSFNIESPAEYRAVAEVGRRLGMKPRVAIRVNPKAAVSGARMSMSGSGKKFGVDADRVGPLVLEMLDDGAVDLRGLHTYAGTQNFAAGGWIENARALLGLAGELESEFGRPIETLNFGGGFGVPYYEGDPRFDLTAVGAGIRDLITQDGRTDRTYFLELGRYLTATAGVYLTRVSYIKESDGHRHAILEGGMHHHSAAAGIGSIMRRSYPIVHCDRADAVDGVPVTLGGPLCTPADEFASDVVLPELRAGDTVAVLASGAYGLTFSSVMFLSHRLPAEVLVDDGTAYLVRERGGDKDPLRGQILP